MERQETQKVLVRLKLIGSIEATDLSGNNLLPPSRKARALLSYLALNASWVPRSRITKLLWDRVPEEQGRASLRQALHELSKSIGPAYSKVIETERERVRLRLEAVWVDALAVEASGDRSSLDSTPDLTVFSGSLLLDGLDNLSDEFDHWLTLERQKLEERIRRWNETNIRSSAQDPPGQEQHVESARRAVAIDPTNEEAVRELMRALASTGQRAQAAIEYERCRAVLRSRLDLEPAAETKQLYRDLRRDAHLEQQPNAIVLKKSGRADADIVETLHLDVADTSGLDDELRIPVRATSPLVHGFGNRPSVAILPFVNTSGDAQYEYFADGLTEEVITALACWRDFPVIARNSSFTYKGRALDVRKVGAELGVRYAVEGSVRRAHESVRVLTQLIDTATGHHILATTFESNLDSAVRVQEEIASRIAGAIEPELQKAESRRAISAAPKSFSAYDLMQRGMWHHHRYTKDDNAEAHRCFTSALELDPEYANAIAALVHNRIHAAYSGWSENRERTFADAFDLAQNAVSLDTRNPSAHFALGMACLWTGRIEVGIKAMRDAIALNPSFAAAHANLGFLLNYCGKPDEAVDYVLKAIRLSPYDNRLFLWLPALAAANYQLQRYEDAIEIGRRALALKPDYPAGLRYVIAALGQLGRSDEALQELRNLQKIEQQAIDYPAVIQKLFRSDAAGAHLVEGLRKAGMKI